MIQGLPAKYIFYLLCSNCKDPDCPHTICLSGRQEVPTWYERGPTVSYLPLPIPNASHPWGSTCSDCKGCYGHFLKPKEALTLHCLNPRLLVLVQLLRSSMGSL